MKTYAWLPEIYRVIAEASSLEAALRLAQAHGGTRIYVPKEAGADHWLSELLGAAGAKALCAFRGREYVTLPTNPADGVNGMRRRAERALDEGLSADEAARRSGFSSRAIYARKAKRKNGERLPDLFHGFDD